MRHGVLLNHKDLAAATVRVSILQELNKELVEELLIRYLKIPKYI